MNYESMIVLSQLVALFFFIIIFGVVVAYVCWPGNKEKFNDAAQLPFEQDDAVQERKG